MASAASTCDPFFYLAAAREAALPRRPPEEHLRTSTFRIASQVQRRAPAAKASRQKSIRRADRVRGLRSWWWCVCVVCGVLYLCVVFVCGISCMQPRCAARVILQPPVCALAARVTLVNDLLPTPIICIPVRNLTAVSLSKVGYGRFPGNYSLAGHTGDFTMGRIGA